MKLEHVALNVAEPVAMAYWYVEHLGLSVVSKLSEAPYTHFMADSSGNMMLEIYHNPPEQVPDYAHMDPLQLHLAFVSANPAEDGARLQKANATLVSDRQLPDGSHLVMMRDPWGLSLQLCKRNTPMLKDF